MGCKMYIHASVRPLDREGSHAVAVEFEGRYCFIGRVKSELKLEDPSCSRQHAVFYQNQGVLHVRDLESKNGTFVNGRRVRDCIIGAGDIVRVGHSQIRIVDWKLDQSAPGALMNEQSGARGNTQSVLVDRVIEGLLKVSEN